MHRGYAAQYARLARRAARAGDLASARIYARQARESLRYAWVEAGTSKTGKKRWKDDSGGKTKYRYQDSKPGEGRKKKATGESKPSKPATTGRVQVVASSPEPAGKKPLKPKAPAKPKPAAAKNPAKAAKPKPVQVPGDTPMGGKAVVVLTDREGIAHFHFFDSKHDATHFRDAFKSSNSGDVRRIQQGTVPKGTTLAGYQQIARNVLGDKAHTFAEGGKQMEVEVPISSESGELNSASELPPLRTTLDFPRNNKRPTTKSRQQTIRRISEKESEVLDLYKAIALKGGVHKLSMNPSDIGTHYRGAAEGFRTRGWPHPSPTNESLHQLAEDAEIDLNRRAGDLLDDFVKVKGKGEPLPPEAGKFPRVLDTLEAMGKLNYTGTDSLGRDWSKGKRVTKSNWSEDPKQNIYLADRQELQRREAVAKEKTRKAKLITQGWTPRTLLSLPGGRVLRFAGLGDTGDVSVRDTHGRVYRLTPDQLKELDYGVTEAPPGWSHEKYESSLKRSSRDEPDAWRGFLSKHKIEPVQNHRRGQPRRYSWRNDGQVGTNKSGDPVYKYVNTDTGEVREQHIEPGSGGTSGATSANNSSAPGKPDAGKSAPGKAPAFKPGHPIEENQAVRDLLEGKTEHDLPAKSLGGLRDTMLEEIVKSMGKDAPPKLASKEEVDQLKKQGWKISYRGVRKPEAAEGLKKGPYWAGSGMFGNGTYVQMEGGFLGMGGKSTPKAIEEARGYGEHVMRIAIPPTAKIVNHSKLEAMQKEYAKELTKRRMAGQYTQPQYELLDRNSKDLGRFAALMGFDAIYCTWDGFYSILNRSMLVIQEENV